MSKSVTIKIYIFLRKQPLYLFIAFILIFNLAISIIISFIGIDLNTEEIFSSKSFITLLFLACIIAPLFETLLIQYFPMELFKNRFKKRTLVRILLSSLLFSIGHTYNFYYMLVMFFMGISLATTYAIQRKKHSRTYAFYAVCLTHCLWNFFVLLEFML
jgi:CAAX amino terminal protease family.